MENETKIVRPGLLTILCILSFLGSSWTIMNAIFQYSNAGTAAALIQKSLDDNKEKLMETSGNSKLAEKMVAEAEKVNTPEGLKKKAIADILSSFFTFLGAFFMFRLSRNGYWLYLLGVAVSIIFPIMAFGFNWGALLSFFLPAGVGVVFAVLYGTQLKFMR